LFIRQISRRISFSGSRHRASRRRRSGNSLRSGLIECRLLFSPDMHRRSLRFFCKNRRSAFFKVRQELGIYGRLTAKAFREAGGALFCVGDVVVIGDIPDS